jgi:hypothetical protein
MTTLFALALLAADPVEIPKHLAETVYEGDLAEAKRIYDLAVAAATERCKAALERASKSATMNGELDKAVAYRDRAKALVVPELVKPLIGKYEFKFADGVVRHYVFDAGGKAQFAFDNRPDENKPEAGELYWFTRNGELGGLMLVAGEAHLISVVKGKPTILSYSRHHVYKGVGEKVK